MCLVSYRPRLGRRSAAFSLERFQQLLQELPDLERITLQGLGEPLLCPDLLPMVELARERGIDVGFNTNGMLLTQPVAERLVAAGVSWLHVSLDGATPATYEHIREGADFARVCDNLQGLLAVRRAAGSSRPWIQVVFVAMQQNVHELPALV